MARRFGSAMISNADAMLFIYTIRHIRVKAYKRRQATVVRDPELQAVVIFPGNPGILNTPRSWISRTGSNSRWLERNLALRVECV